MRVDGQWYRSIDFDRASGRVMIIDQTRLPFEFETVALDSLSDFCTAIQTMQVRGAPLIGATAAYGLALAAREDASDAALENACEQLYATRPTAVNLRWALEGMYARLSEVAVANRAEAALDLAAALCEQDIAANAAIGEHGMKLIKASAGSKPSGEAVNILTHCNAGWLATVDWGTALAPVYKAHEAGLPVHVWVDETRPRNQGASLTTWELTQHGVPHTLIVDNAGGYLMQHDQVDLCLVGSDRTTASGDVCNKIGTYLKALAAFDNHVPFCVALPGSTIDWRLGAEAAQEDAAKAEDAEVVPIEMRDAQEVSHIRGMDASGEIHEVRLAPAGCAALNPAFDVTPAKYITTLITERGLCAANTEALHELFQKTPG